MEQDCLRMRLSDGVRCAIEFSAPENPTGFANRIATALTHWRDARRRRWHDGRTKTFVVQWDGAEIHCNVSRADEPPVWAKVGLAPARRRGPSVERPEGWNGGCPAPVCAEDAEYARTEARALLARIGREMEHYDRIHGLIRATGDAIQDALAAKESERRIERARRLIERAFVEGAE